MIRASAKRQEAAHRIKFQDAKRPKRPSARRSRLKKQIARGLGLVPVKVKVPSGLHALHVGNAAIEAHGAHSCCSGNGGNAELVACPACPACPARGASRGSCNSAGLGPGPGPAPGRRLVKGLRGKGQGPKGPGLWLLSRANCPCSDSAKCPSESCFMFMFRNRRNTLTKRLWNARVLQRDQHGQTAGQAQTSGQSFLRRLKDPQLETLHQAVESRGASLTSCVVLDRDLDTDEPHLLCCQIWRWPELQQASELRPLPMCGTGANSICCNPYHWSRLCKPESPPPPYGRLPEKRLKPEDCAPSEGGPAVAPRTSPQQGGAPLPLDEPCKDPPDLRDLQDLRDAAWGRTPPRWQGWQTRTGSLTTNGEGPGMRSWCQLAYWELADRVGRLCSVERPFINVSSAAEPSGRGACEGLCLATLANQAPVKPAGAAVERTRAKIGLGVTLSQEADGVWAYNRSDHPIFVNSPTLDDPDSRTLLVYRVPPGHCLNVFRTDTTSQHWERWRRVNEAAHSGPVDPRAVRISFAKGWGPKYSRQEVTACPCWIEVLLSPCR